MHVTVAGRAVTGADPSPAERMISERGHEVDTSVIVNFTLRGATPDSGTTVSVAFVVSVGVAASPTVTVIDWRICWVLMFAISALYVPALAYV